MQKETSQLERERKKEMEQIGEAIRMEMHRQKLTVVDLSAKSGVSRPIVDRIIKAKNYTVSNFVDVCIALHVKPFIVLKNESI